MPNKKPYLVGLTGGIATGKSGISKALLAKDLPVIDLDQISRDLTKDGGIALPKLRAVFGDAVFNGDSLDRKKLAAIVFHDAAALDQLNQLMHPLIFDEMYRQIAEHADAPFVVIDAPLLFETGLDKLVDEIWCAWAPPDEQLRRVMKRDQVSAEDATARMAAQWQTADKVLKSDQVIDTTGTREDTRLMVAELVLDLLRRLSLEPET